MDIKASKIMMWKGILLGAIATLIISSVYSSNETRKQENIKDIPVLNASLLSHSDSERIAIIDEDLPEAISYSAQEFEKTFASAAKIATPPVVTVAASKLVKQRMINPFDFFNNRGRNQGEEREFESRQSGSGVIISKDGYIVTNNHVVDGVEEITITMQDKRVYDAKIIGADPLTDIALLKIEVDEDLPAMKIGDSKKLFIGQHVLAIGNPLSIGTTVTTGIVSALRRNIGILERGYGIESFIQTDAAINPGNSGGALVDLNGNLVGINTAIASATGYYSGYGFAVPTHIVSYVTNELKEHGKVRRGYIGISLESVDYKVAKQKGFKAPKGVYVQQVLPNMPGEEAGIEQDDIILEVDGVDVNEPNMLQAEVSSKPFDSKVKLKIFRDGKSIVKTLQLRARPDDTTVTLASSETKLNSLGMSVRTLSEFKAKQLDIEYGVEISDVKRFSEAFRSNLKEGDVLLKIGSKRLNKPSDLNDYLADIKSGDTVKIFVQPANGSFKRYVYLEIP